MFTSAQIKIAEAHVALQLAPSQKKKKGINQNKRAGGQSHLYVKFIHANAGYILNDVPDPCQSHILPNHRAILFFPEDG